MVEAEQEVLGSINKGIENTVAGSTVLMETIVLPPITEVGLGFETWELVAFSTDPNKVDELATEKEKDGWSGFLDGIFE